MPTVRQRLQTEIRDLKAELAEAASRARVVQFNTSNLEKNFINEVARAEAAELENEGLKNGSRDLMAANATLCEALADEKEATARLVDKLRIERNECESARAAAGIENQLRRGSERKMEGCKMRLRDTANILINKIGATGPEDADSVARRAVVLIKNLESKLALMTKLSTRHKGADQ